MSAAPASALDPARSIGQYSRDSWTTVDGLPQASVLSIAQTRDGYLWFGTHAGLARFDGASFTAFDPDNSPGLLGRRVQALLAAPDGSLWIGTDGRGIAHLRDGVFETLGNDLEPGLADASGNGFYRDGSGVLWIADWSGLARLDRGRVSWTRKAEGLENESLFGVAGDGKGAVYVATSTGPWVVRDGRASPVKPDLGAAEAVCLLVDRRGVLWVGTSAGLDRIEGGRGRRLTTKDGLLANSVTALVEDADGNVWIGTVGGLNRWNEGRIDAFSAADGLPGGAVASLFEDREGSLWVGLRGAGIVRLRDGALTSYSRRDGLAADDATCVFQSSDGSLWIGTTRGLSRWRDGRFTTFTQKDGLLNEAVSALGEDPRYGVIVATHDSRLNVFRDGRLGVLDVASSLETVPSVLRRDREGALWIGTLGAGLYRLQGGRREHFPFANSLGRYVIYDALQDSAGVLWFATPNGLLRHEHGRFSAVEVHARGANLGVAYALHEDGGGSLWVATRDAGLCRLRGGQPPRCYGRRQGLLDDTVYSILEDDAGRLFLSTPRGIGVVARRDLDDLDAGRLASLPGLRLGVEDGMQTAECQGLLSPAGWKARDGRLWFPTLRGVVVADPSRIAAPTTAPPVAVASVVVDGQSLPLRGEVVAEPGRGGIAIGYAGLSFRAPEAIRFRYRLDGFDPDWVEAGGRRVARYTNIPPGSYRFRVTAAQGLGPWNPDAATVVLRLRPHFYQTRAWLAGLVLAGLGLVWGAYWLRVRSLRLQAAELSRKVQEAVANVKALRGLLPICANCKRIRHDEGSWQQIEAYIRAHSEAEFTHGMCPECMRQFYPTVADRVLGRTSPQNLDR